MNIKKIVSIFLAVVSVVMIGIGVYLMNSSKYIFTTALDHVFDYLTEGYLSIQTDNYDKFKLTTKNTVAYSTIELATIDGEFYADIPNSKIYLDLDSTVMSEDYIALESLIEEGKIYLKIKEIMDDFYYDTLDITDSFEEISYEQVRMEESEINLLVKYLKDSILKDLTDKDFDKTSQTIRIDGNNFKTTKIALNLSQKRMGKIIENFLTSVINDNEAIQILQKLDKTITKTDIQETLKMFKENASSYSEDEELCLAFYIEGFGSLRRIEFASIDDTDSIANQSGIRFDLYNNNHKQKTYMLSAYGGESDLMTFKLEYTNDTAANLSLTADDVVVSGTLENTKNTQTVKLSLSQEGKSLGDLEYNYTVISKGKEYKIDVIINVQSMITITSNNTLIIDEEIPNINVSDAIDFDDMSEEDQQELSEYLDEKLAIFDMLGSDDEEDSWDEESDW